MSRTLLLFFLSSTMIYKPAAHAEDVELTPREKYNFYLRGEVSSTARDDENTSSDHFKHRNAALGGYLPIYSRVSDDSSLKYYKWGADGSAQQIRVDSSLYPGELRYLNSNIGFSNWILFKNNELAFLHVGYSRFEESGGADSYSLTGIGATTYRLTPDSRLIYGLYYGSVVEGQLAVRPLLGVRSSLSEQWSIKFLLPLSLSATYKINPKIQAQFYIRPDSLRLPIKNEQKFAGYDDDLLLRSKRFKLGTELQYRFLKDWTVAPELGIISRQDNVIEDGNRKVVTSTQQASGYVQIRIQFHR